MHSANKKLGKRQAMRRSSQPMVEPLEARQLLSASLQDGTLIVSGTRGNDTITVALNGATGQRLAVKVNGQREIFVRKTVEVLRIKSGRGNDRINVFSNVGLSRAQVRVNDGLGNDKLLGLARKVARPAGSGDSSPDDAGHGATDPHGGNGGVEDPLPADDQTNGGGTPVEDPPPIDSEPENPPATGDSDDPAVPPAAPTSGFTFYDAVAFVGKPTSSALGMESIYLTDREFYAGREGSYDRTRADETATRALARKVASLNRILVVDIEHWPVDIRYASQAAVDESIAKLIQLVDWVHDEQPELKVGFYGLMPLGDYWSPVNYMTAVENAANHVWWGSNLPLFQTRYRAWQAANDYLRPLAEKVDFVCPSLYTFYDDPGGWKKYAQANIAEARRTGKPVLPFLWMDYHDSNATLRGQEMPADDWRLELETVSQLADGAIIWGGWRVAPDGSAYRAQWDSAAPWWTTLDTFMAEQAQAAA